MMNKLINKYQDGELSQDEIAQLHKAISSSEVVRRKMLIASVLRDTIDAEKANIQMPEEFFTQVEDDIMMRYLKEVPAEQTNFVLGLDRKKTPLYTHINRTMRYAATIAIIIFGALYSISELNINMPMQQIAQTQMPKDNSAISSLQDATDENNIAEVTDVAQVQSNIDTEDNNYNTSASASFSASVPMAGIEILDNTDIAVEMPKAKINALNTENVEKRNNEGSAETIEVTESINTAEVTRNAIMAAPIFANTQITPINDAEKSGKRSNDGLITMASINHTSLNNFNFLKIDRGITASVNLPEPLGNQLSYGNDFMNPTPLNFISHGAIMTNSLGTEVNPDKPVITFAQSIGFDIGNTKHGGGFEFGYSQLGLYTYKEVIIPNPAPMNMGSSVESPNSGSGQSKSNDGTKTFLKSLSETSLFFGNIYYEYNIIRLENTQLTGRVGIGLCGREPLGVVKLYGKQRIYNNLFLTLGFENRTFGIDMIGMQGDKYLSMFNFIYGVQIEL